MRGLRHLSVQNEALSKAVSHQNVHFHAKSNSFSYLEGLVLKQRQSPEIMADPGEISVCMACDGIPFI